MERQVAACHIAGALAGIRCSARDTEVIGIKTGAISRTDLKINRTQASDFFIIWVYLYHTTTQMRYLLFVVIGLIGCFPLRAQTPEDNLRDEEYYPFQNGYEEPYSPMIDTDSSLFYRAIQSTGDLFRRVPPSALLCFAAPALRCLPAHKYSSCPRQSRWAGRHPAE